MLIISDKAAISPLADIEDSTRGTRIVIGEGTMVDAFVKIKPVGGDADVVIGRDCRINSGTVIYTGNGVTIGDGVLIASNCSIAPVSHEYHARDRKIAEQRFRPSKGGIVIEDDVWIGANCVVLDGAILRRGCVIGAHSLVQGEVEAYSVNVGNPLRKTGRRT
jgi:acetyltransferase-like isoleucine patch superfamily enzyme